MLHLYFCARHVDFVCTGFVCLLALSLRSIKPSRVDIIVRECTLNATFRLGSHSWMCWFMLAMENNKTNAIEQVVCSRNVFTASKQWMRTKCSNPSERGAGWVISGRPKAGDLLKIVQPVTVHNLHSEPVKMSSVSSVNIYLVTKFWFSSQRHHNQTPTVLKNKLKWINK